MRQISMIMLLTGVAALSACGGGATGGTGGAPSTSSTTGTTGEGGGGGQGSTTAAATTSAATSTSTSTSTSTGVGGMGGGGTTTATSASSGSSTGSGGPTGVVGDPCATDATCAGGLCLDEAMQGWPQGYCSAKCDPMAPACPGTALCVDDGTNSGTGVCLEDCSMNPNACGAAYSCLDFGIGHVCYPTCTLDAQCAGFCNADNGFCSATNEDCTNGMDDDGDNLTDCEDLDCKASCGGQITAACGLATPALASNMGDTTMGSNVFAGSCTGAGAHETTFSITAGVAGQLGSLTATVSAAVDLGIYARLACTDAATEVACVDAVPGRTDEVLVLEIAGGTPLTLFVDGYASTEEGPFTLTTSYQDNAPLCAAAVTAAIGANAGDTTTGTNSFGGSCTGGGAQEQVYTFVPTADGTLHLDLSSAADLGIYVRKTCADKTTELGCSDLFSGGGTETLDVAVKSGVAVTIFVDGYTSAELGPFSLTATLM
jgi:hypothetical protein